MGRKWGRLTLEMSLKPFRSIADQDVRETMQALMHLWRYMINRSDAVTILLWVGDGSEILTWSGNQGQKLEWAKYVGFSNFEHCGFVSESREYLRATPYMDHPPDWTYADLARVVRLIKQTALDMYGITVEVGTTFDPGPEFAPSDFKYKHHPEINEPRLGRGYLPTKADYEVVCPWAVLRGDNESYAAYLEGIPDGTPFGEFFGRQSYDFMRQMGFDYIWFSNGFGYSIFPWTYQGASFDGERFGTGDYREMANRILGFWKAFRNANSFRVEVRGSNFSTGMEICKDSIPVKELYDQGHLLYPAPNSPWGYLDANFGVELGGYLTRIASTPGEHFPFRFYLDDPWFWQICWKHGFERRAHEIYGPLATGRIEADGSMRGADMLEILAVDGERGQFDEQNALEAIPHLRKALDEQPDEPGIVTWLYPFSEHHAFAEADSVHQPTIFFNDWIVCNAINNGLPLNTVINTDTFAKMDDEVLFRRMAGKTVLLAPTAPLAGVVYDRLVAYVRSGGEVIFYGPAGDGRLRELLNLELDGELSGDLRLEAATDDDEAIPGLRSAAYRHDPLVCAGGVGEVVRDASDPYTQICATVRSDGEERVYALIRNHRNWKGGRAGWIRGGLPFDTRGVSKLPARYPADYADSSALLVRLLRHFGYTLTYRRHDNAARTSLTLISRHDNAVLFTGYKFDATERADFSFPDGAPIVTAGSALVKGDRAAYVWEKAYRYEARVFVRQSQGGVVTCRHAAFMEPTPLKSKTCALEVSGLIQATVTIRPPLDFIRRGIVEAFVREREGACLAAVSLNYGPADECIVLTGISGHLEISW